MTIRTIFLSGIFCLALLPAISQAKVDYISLHEIETEDRQPLSVKLNIVETQQESQLKFTLVSQNIETKLEYQRINKYMLRLKSPHYIIGKASVYVHEFEQNVWHKTHSIDISNALIATDMDKITLANAAEKNKQCLLTHAPKETLWSIASRYKDKWSVNVFSAMIAIYKSNLNKFAKQHIGQLIDKSELFCPSTETITSMGEKTEMKAEFNRLNKQTK
jgi:hypothetical protein